MYFLYIVKYNKILNMCTDEIRFRICKYLQMYMNASKHICREASERIYNIYNKIQTKT